MQETNASDVHAGATEGNRFTLTARKNSTTAEYDFLFEATSTGQLLKVSYRLPPSQDWETLEVLGYVNTSGAVDAVTADFDLFAVCPHHSVLARPGTVLKALPSSSLGRITAFEKKVMVGINKKLTATGAYPLVRHGPDAYTQPAQGSADLVMFTLACTSRMVNGSRVATVWAELVKRGFYAPLNSSWVYNSDIFSTVKSWLTSKLSSPSNRGDRTLLELGPKEMVLGVGEGQSQPVTPLPVLRTNRTTGTTLKEFVGNYYEGAISLESWR